MPCRVFPNNKQDACQENVLPPREYMFTMFSKPYFRIITHPKWLTS